MHRTNSALSVDSCSNVPQPLPPPQTPIAIRPAHLGDLPFIDRLQKMHTKMVGWMPRKQLEGKIAAGHVLVARASSPCADATGARPSPLPSPGIPGEGERVGYVISRDQYFKRDDVGIIYQLNVLPTHQRGLIGAHLLKAVFDRAAYGCRLFCCWCAQDIAANRFWEAMGFVPLAFRAGSEKRSRIHIFWQKRIREGDETTPWWFPCKTDSGAIREDRIVLPIPPGVRWCDEMPLILPEAGNPKCEVQVPKQIENRTRGEQRRAQSKIANPHPPAAKRPPLNIASGLRMVAQTQVKPSPKPKAAKRVRSKCDPTMIAAARECRDRWLEQVNSGNFAAAAAAKYAISRQSAPSGAKALNSPTKMIAA